MNKNESLQFELFNQLLDEKRKENDERFFQSLGISKNAKVYRQKKENSYIDFYIPNCYTINNSDINIQSTTLTIKKIKNIKFGFYSELDYIEKNIIKGYKSTKIWGDWKNDVENNFIKLSAEELVEELVLSWNTYLIKKNQHYKNKMETVKENSIIFLFNDFKEKFSSIRFMNCKNEKRVCIYFINVFTKVFNRILISLMSEENKSKISFWKLFFYIKIDYSFGGVYDDEKFRDKKFLYFKHLNKNYSKSMHPNDFNKWDEETANFIGLDYKKDSPYDHKTYSKWSKKKNILMPIFKNVLKK